MTRLAPALTALMLAAAPALAQGYSAAEVDAFARADTNRNGVLTLPEFRVFVRHMAAAGQPTARQIRTFAAYRMAFGIVDTNNDGVASPEELRRADTDHRAGTGPASQ